LRVSAKAPPPVLDMDMTPMIDVVFQLLIFFMLCSAFNEAERAAKLQLPMAYQAMFQKDVDKERTIVNIERDGTIVMYEHSYTIEQFKVQLAKVAQLLRAMGARTGQAPIVLRGDRLCEFKHIREVIAAVYDARIEKVMFAAYQKPAGESE
jgi:biopolymer transport protein ExbD